MNVFYTIDKISWLTNDEIITDSIKCIAVLVGWFLAAHTWILGMDGKF